MQCLRLGVRLIATKLSNDIVYVLSRCKTARSKATLHRGNCPMAVWHISTVGSTIADPSAYNSEDTKEWPLPEKRNWPPRYKN